MKSPVVPVSCGEFVDRMTILAIKANRLRDGVARDNVRAEAERLRQSMMLPSGIEVLAAALLAVNVRLWRIEDLIREREAARDFGPNFIRLARAVYHENDERARIKRAINQQLQSALVEEKQYASYERPIAHEGYDQNSAHPGKTAGGA